MLTSGGFQSFAPSQPQIGPTSRMRLTLRGERRVEGESQDAGTIPPEDVGEEDVEEREARVEDRVAHDAVSQVVAERLGLGDGRARRRRRGGDRRDRRDGFIFLSAQ